MKEWYEHFVEVSQKALNAPASDFKTWEELTSEEQERIEKIATFMIVANDAAGYAHRMQQQEDGDWEEFVIKEQT